METYTVAITDPAHVAGITAAREAYNASLPPIVEGEEPAPTIETNADYVQFVMSRAAGSYAKQYGTE